MRQEGTSCIRALAANRAEQIAYYRFLDNEKVSLSELAASLSAHCQEQVRGRHILAISDSSEINLQQHVGRLKPEGQGVVGNDRDVGFFVHPTLAVDSESGLPLGLSGVQLWTRPCERVKVKERDYQTEPIETKESYKWVEAAKNSQACYEEAGVEQVTHIGDSEADIYEPWFLIPNPRTHLLVRACKDRRLADQEQNLFDYLTAQPCGGCYELDIPEQPRRGRPGRRATMAVSWTPVTLHKPKKLQQDYPQSIQLLAVEVVELSPPPDTEPVHWRLLTTHRVTNFEQARQIITWYCWRWPIELLFAILKQRGLDLEATQLESFAAIQKLCLFALAVALQVLQLTLGRDNQAESASLVFAPAQHAYLAQIAPKLDGRTPKQRNPHPTHSLAWASWLMARLGGWSGYRSQRPPGFATLYRGLRKFKDMFRGWQLAAP